MIKLDFVGVVNHRISWSSGLCKVYFSDSGLVLVSFLVQGGGELCLIFWRKGVKLYGRQDRSNQFSFLPFILLIDIICQSTSNILIKNVCKQHAKNVIFSSRWEGLPNLDVISKLLIFEFSAFMSSFLSKLFFIQKLKQERGKKDGCIFW